LAQAISQGSIGRRDTVLIGDPSEIAALRMADLLVFCGATQVRRFALNPVDEQAKQLSEDIFIF